MLLIAFSVIVRWLQLSALLTPGESIKQQGNDPNEVLKWKADSITLLILVSSTKEEYK